MNRYLVIGPAKTGTTVISKTIQNSQGIKNYYLEPKHVGFFEHMATHKEDGVVKIIFDHWMERPRALNSIVYDEAKAGFKATIIITRDPRAEIVSRVHYVAFPYFSSEDRPVEAAQEWISLFKRKESDASFSLRDLVGEMERRFGVNVTHSAGLTSRRYANFVRAAPSTQIMIRYEDFIQNRLQDHDHAYLFAGSHDVGPKLERTRRSGDADDWKSYTSVSDIAWLNEIVGQPAVELGYKREVNVGGEIKPENCSLYVARIIEEAMASRKPAEPK